MERKFSILYWWYFMLCPVIHTFLVYLWPLPFLFTPCHATHSSKSTHSMGKCAHIYMCTGHNNRMIWDRKLYFFHPFAQYLYVCIVYGLMYNFFTAILSQIYPIFFSILLLPSFSNISSYCICKATAITTTTAWKRYRKCPHITLDKYMNVHGNIYRCMDIHTPYTNMKMECRMTQKVGEKIKLWFEGVKRGLWLSIVCME